MKTISDFSLYCTPEQTKKALELNVQIEVQEFKGGELDSDWYYDITTNFCCHIPTAEQMIGWLRKEKNINIAILRCQDGTYYNFYQRGLTTYFDTYEEATLAAIDAALEYLSNNKK